MSPDSLFVAVWKGGSLHGAHWKDCLDESIFHPLLVMESIRGNNCVSTGYTLTRTLETHLGVLDCAFVAPSVHSREPHACRMLAETAEYVMQQMLLRPDWLIYLFDHEVDPNNLTVSQEELLKAYSKRASRARNRYGDRRLLRSLRDMRLRRPIYSDKRIYAGAEASVDENGALDTQQMQKADVRVMSCHVAVSPRLIPISEDPDLYSDFWIRAIHAHPDVHVVGHIGEGCSTPKDKARVWAGKLTQIEADYRFMELLRWPEIAAACLANNTALEIKYVTVVGPLFHRYGDGDLFQPYADGKEQEWKTVLDGHVAKLPILHSQVIRDQLRPFIKQGLPLAIDHDLHSLPESDCPEGLIRDGIAHAASIIDPLLADMDVTADNVVNVWPTDRFEDWLGLTDYH